MRPILPMGRRRLPLPARPWHQQRRTRRPCLTKKSVSRAQIAAERVSLIVAAFSVPLRHVRRNDQGDERKGSNHVQRIRYDPNQSGQFKCRAACGPGQSIGIDVCQQDLGADWTSIIQAPKTVYNWLKLAEQGKYNDVVFHRLIPGFMVRNHPGP